MHRSMWKTSVCVCACVTEKGIFKTTPKILKIEFEGEKRGTGRKKKKKEGASDCFETLY